MIKKIYIRVCLSVNLAITCQRLKATRKPELEVKTGVWPSAALWKTLTEELTMKMLF